MRFHDLRHTTATLLLRAGVDAHRVQRLLRHHDVRTTTGIYGHLDVEDLRAAVATLPGLGPNWVQMDPPPRPRPKTAPPTPRTLMRIRGGRCRIRTCDPCRVNQVQVVSRPTPRLATSRNHRR